MKYLLPLMFMVMSCNSKDCCVFPDEYCYKFDIRACETDQFASIISDSLSVEDRELGLLEWLGSKDVNVLDVQLRLDQLGAVCEACDVCPTGDQFYIRSYEVDLEAAVSDLRLLNFTQVECD